MDKLKDINSMDDLTKGLDELTNKVRTAIEWDLHSFLRVQPSGKMQELVKWKADTDERCICIKEWYAGAGERLNQAEADCRNLHTVE